MFMEAALGVSVFFSPESDAANSSTLRHYIYSSYAGIYKAEDVNSIGDGGVR